MEPLESGIPGPKQFHSASAQFTLFHLEHRSSGFSRNESNMHRDVHYRAAFTAFNCIGAPQARQYSPHSVTLTAAIANRLSCCAEEGTQEQRQIEKDAECSPKKSIH
jgi:hypothetical protein